MEIEHLREHARAFIRELIALGNMEHNFDIIKGAYCGFVAIGLFEVTEPRVWERTLN